MGISKIEFKNYKSFENAEFNISPITILLGANSIGKSSVIQLLLMLSQTFRKENGRGDLLLNSNLIELGEDINLLKDKDITKKLKIKLYLDRKVDFNEYSKSYIDNLVNSCYQILNNYENILVDISNISDLNIMQDYAKEIKSIKTKYREIRLSSNNKSNSIMLKDFFEDLSQLIKKIKRAINKVFSNNSIAVIDIQTYEVFSELKKIDINMYLQMFYKIPEIVTNSIDSIEYTFAYKNSKLSIESFEVFNKDILILGISYLNKNTLRKMFSIDSTIIDSKTIKILKSDFSKDLKFNYLKPYWKGEKRNTRSMRFSNILHQSPVGLFYYGLLEKTIEIVSSKFKSNRIRHVKPIRAYPKRYYFVKDQMDSKNEVNINEGEEIIIVLQSKPVLLNEINEWLEIHYNLIILIKPITDTIYSIGISHNGLELDISDVGFGISQLLPILIQLLSNDSKKSTIIIEQPEIHIHPKAQADLIDLFISIANKYEKEIIIETHSEAFLKRLRRRISEYSEDNLSSIKSDNVSIHTFEREDNKTIINNVIIEANGAFEWPKEFLDYSLDDTIAYLKNQA